MANAFTSIKRLSLVREKSIRGRFKIASSADARRVAAEYWEQDPTADQERFSVILLDTKHVVQAIVPITTGVLDASLIHPREVFKPAVLEGSASLILTHNHPSGDPSPSREDIAVTDRLTQAGETLGIEVLDHIIYGDGSGLTYSTRESQ